MTSASRSPATTASDPVAPSTARASRSVTTSSGRARASRSTAGRSDSNAPPSVGGHGEPHGQPVAGSTCASARALRTARTNSTSAPTSASAAASRCPGDRPAGDDQQVRIVRSVGQGAPELLRHERHDRVEQAQVRVQRLDERPPRRLARLGGQRVVGQPDLRELEAPVAELRPDAVVQRPGDLAELVVGDRPVHLGGRRRRPRQDPALGRAEQRAAIRCNARRAVPGSTPGRAPSTNRVAFQSLLAKFRRVLDLLLAESLVDARRRAVDQREPHRVRTGLVDHPSGSTTLPFVFDIFAPYGSRMRPDR